MKLLSKLFSFGQTRESLSERLDRPVITLPVPDYHLFEDDRLELFIWPPNQSSYQVEVIENSNKESVRLDDNVYRGHSLKAGRKCSYRARYYSETLSAWSPWSKDILISFHSHDEEDKVQQLREYDHQISMMSCRDINGVTTITNPYAFPPSYAAALPAKWFRTPCYEGSTMIINENPEYYHDPLSYLVDHLVLLKNKGAAFRGWNDLLSNPAPLSDLEVIVQFDLDAGVHSFERVLQRLLPLDIRGNIMVHRKCCDWYEYQIEDIDTTFIKKAEQQGWTIGYHNNSISNLHSGLNTCRYDADILEQATEAFRSDLQVLRTMFDIQTYTHHGGNVFNKKTPAPEGINAACVDKAFNPDLWKTINSAFSDGGFFMRPCPLSQKIDALEKGRHFFRLHPVKYGNYTPPFDVFPLEVDDLTSRGIDISDQSRKKILDGQQKQLRWLENRNQHRLARRLNYDRPVKPISEKLRPFSDLETTIHKHYERRKGNFRRLYPWIGGDPRVFWWRILDAFVPSGGEILNIGAMPPDRKDETTDFISPDVTVLEMDIDPARKPDLLCDITQADSSLNDRFDAVLFFGLPCVHSPSLAVEATLRLTKPGGVAIFGFASATHTARGGFWNPAKFPVYQKDLEPLQGMDSGRLWSYDMDAVEHLFGKFPNTLIESFAHYWFVVCYQ